ncbi:ferredoxin [Allocatelliglobosispora scoriae]|uniref:Ferredoxin n=1 Tax=Allocatelliglobosispora scoriae TaxID=643052 RepID=A0A841C162_9ACTN|nr:ferredoxin [Allocatelliglobosispora scoriae]MBB5874104.1 ferredoxin [Allocatelliglobosispora scoriae]
MNPEATWRVRVNTGACIGSGSCVGIAPRHLFMDSYVALPLRELVEPDEDLLAAADSCPAEAINVIDTATGESLIR